MRMYGNNGPSIAGERHGVQDVGKNNGNGIKGHKIGFSFSPGGLLFPYHLGVLTSLTESGYITPSTPLAGSSAGALAVASHASGADPAMSLQSCVTISQRCAELGGARGRLLSLVEEELQNFMPDNAHEVINSREGFTGLAYREIFPVSRSVLAHQFESREELIETICNSAMFPFFTANKPFLVRRGSSSSSSSSSSSTLSSSSSASPSSTQLVAPDLKRLSSGEDDRENGRSGDIGKAGNGRRARYFSLSTSVRHKIRLERNEADLSDVNEVGNVCNDGCLDESSDKIGADTKTCTISTSRSKSLREIPTLPRLVVDGFFTTSRRRFGCPKFPRHLNVHRTITVSCFPHDACGLTVSDRQDRICPPMGPKDKRVTIMLDLFRKAARPSSEEELKEMYENGRKDGFRWVKEEEEREGIRNKVEHSGAGTTKALDVLENKNGKRTALRWKKSLHWLHKSASRRGI